MSDHSPRTPSGDGDEGGQTTTERDEARARDGPGERDEAKERDKASKHDGADGPEGFRLGRRDYVKALGAAGAAGLGATASVGSVQAAPVGNGSYATDLPAGESEPQGAIYTTANVSGPVQTNDWWSSVAWMGTGENLFWHPGYGNPTETGLEVGYPSEWSFPASDAVLGYAADFALGHAGGTFADVRVDGWSDWGVDLRWGAGTGTTLDVTLVQGSPFVYAEYAGGGAELDFEATPSVWADRGNVLGVSVDGTHYGLFAPAGATWGGVGSATLTNDLAGTNGSGYLTVAILPDDAGSTLDEFARYAYNHVTDTRVEPTYDRANGRVSTTFSFTTDDKPESADSGTITALYPHQHKYTDASFAPYTYECARGTMKTVAGSSFETSYDFPGVLPGLPDEGGYDRSRLAGYVGDVAESIDDSQGSGTYWTGKNYGRLSNAAVIADQIGETAKRDGLRGTMRAELENWLTADDGEAADLFYYNDNWGTLIGYPDSFGSAGDLNDHHFHYGYFVRGAAELARQDPSWADDANWGGMIELLIRDYANWERPSGAQDPANNPGGSFPFLRNFSPYAGHSWAAGSAEFGDGNNQESSSEAIQSYGAMVQYATFTGDDDLLEWAVSLYTTEVTAALEYWFDVDDENHPDGWDHDTAGIVWGSKLSHATWFSGDPEAIHGINYLPFDGHSLYLGWHPDAAGRNYDELVAENGTTFDYWADIVWNYRAFSDPDDAASMFEAQAGSYSPEFGETKAHTYHWIYTLLELGNPRRDVTADHPLAHVFDDGGELTYVAYNGADTTTTVTFSDGTSLSIPANSFATRTGDGSGGGSGDGGTGGDDGGTGDGSDGDDGGSDDGGSGGGDGNADSGTTDDFSYAVSRISGADGVADELRFEYVSNVDSNWVDVHYTVDGGTQYNYRMNNPSGDTHALETTPDYVVGDFSAGDVIDYYFTYEVDGAATDSGWFSVTY